MLIQDIFSMIERMEQEGLSGFEEPDIYYFESSRAPYGKRLANRLSKPAIMTRPLDQQKRKIIKQILQADNVNLEEEKQHIIQARQRYKRKKTQTISTKATNVQTVVTVDNYREQLKYEDLLAQAERNAVYRAIYESLNNQKKDESYKNKNDGQKNNKARAPESRLQQIRAMNRKRLQGKTTDPTSSLSSRSLSSERAFQPQVNSIQIRDKFANIAATSCSQTFHSDLYKKLAKQQSRKESLSYRWASLLFSQIQMQKKVIPQLEIVIDSLSSRIINRIDTNCLKVAAIMNLDSSFQAIYRQKLQLFKENYYIDNKKIRQHGEWLELYFLLRNNKKAEFMRQLQQKDPNLAGLFSVLFNQYPQFYRSDDDINRMGFNHVQNHFEKILKLVGLGRYQNIFTEVAPKVRALELAWFILMSVSIKRQEEDNIWANLGSSQARSLDQDKKSKLAAYKDSLAKDSNSADFNSPIIQHSSYNGKLKKKVQPVKIGPEKLPIKRFRLDQLAQASKDYCQDAKQMCLANPSDLETVVNYMTGLLGLGELRLLADLFDQLRSKCPLQFNQCYFDFVHIFLVLASNPKFVYLQSDRPTAASLSPLVVRLSSGEVLQGINSEFVSILQKLLVEIVNYIISLKFDSFPNDNNYLLYFSLLLDILCKIVNTCEELPHLSIIVTQLCGLVKFTFDDLQAIAQFKPRTKAEENLLRLILGKISKFIKIERQQDHIKVAKFYQKRGYKNEYEQILVRLLIFNYDLAEKARDSILREADPEADQRLKQLMKSPNVAAAEAYLEQSMSADNKHILYFLQNLKKLRDYVFSNNRELLKKNYQEFSRFRTSNEKVFSYLENLEPGDLAANFQVVTSYYTNLHEMGRLVYLGSSNVERYEKVKGELLEELQTFRSKLPGMKVGSYSRLIEALSE